MIVIRWKDVEQLPHAFVYLSEGISIFRFVFPTTEGIMSTLSIIEDSLEKDLIHFIWASDVSSAWIDVIR